MDIVEFAIEQTDEDGQSALRPVYDAEHPIIYPSEEFARNALSYITGTRDDDETFRVVSRTVSPWSVVRDPNRCTCGHMRDQHEMNSALTVCAVTVRENIGDDGHDEYADDCVKFTPVSAV
jgi:hypothetical protein